MPQTTPDVPSSTTELMTPRARVRAAITYSNPDRTPMDFGGTAMSVCKEEFLVKLREVFGFALPANRDADGTWVDEAIQRELGVDLRFVPWGPPLSILRDLDPAAYAVETAKRATRKVDASIKNPAVRHDFPLVDYSYEQIKALRPQPITSPPAHLDWLIDTAKSYRAGGYATTYWVSGGFFEAGCNARGYEQFAIDLLTEPELVQALFDLWLPEKLAQVELLVKPLAPYIDLFCFGDDLGLQTGPFLAPTLFRELVKPYYDEHYGQVHAAAPDSFIFHHSCGSIYRLLDDIIAMGVNVLNPIQPNAMEMEAERLREKVQGRLCLHGGIDLQDLLPFGTPDEVRAEATRRKAILGDGGGYICAAAHSLPEDVPVENILALFGKG
ncbi:MAG TPA: uroporphyrinogen decarboxylase family protein [Armatimonadota bacterium]|jgi:uroporphyrinogen decarboxylase